MNKSTVVASVAFKLVHLDIWGPYKTHSLQGFKYFLTIVDDCTRSTWTIMLIDKASTFTVVQNFIFMVQNQFNAKVKTIRTNNDTEFINKQCQTLFESLGIVHQLTCPYTP